MAISSHLFECTDAALAFHSIQPVECCKGAVYIRRAEFGEYLVWYHTGYGKLDAITSFAKAILTLQTNKWDLADLALALVLLMTC
jgi:hypothetical protein